MALDHFTPVALLLAASLSLGGCGKKSDAAALAPAAKSLAPSTSDAGAGAWHYAIGPSGSVHVELPGLKERIVGDATGVAGVLEVVPTDLAQSRGSVRVDLAT